LSARLTPSLARVSTALLLVGAAFTAACGSPAMTDAERLVKGKEILKAAVSRIAAAQTVTVDVRQEITRGDAASRKTQNITNVVHLRRPDRVHVTTTGDVSRDFWYDGVNATIALHGEKVFGEAPMPPTVDEAIDAITTRYDLPLPMADLLYADAPATLDAAASTGGYMGSVTLNGVQASHLSFTTGQTTWQLWVKEGSEPVILQAHVDYAGRRSKPTHHMVFNSWTFGDALADDVFVARFADDYEGIAMLQRAEAVTEAREATAQEAAGANLSKASAPAPQR
jgi:hypothetical protein